MGKARATFATLTTAALVLALAACTAGDDPPEDGDPSSSSPASPTPTEDPIVPEDVVTSVDVAASPGTIAVDVHPLVRTDEGLVLTLDLQGEGVARVTSEAAGILGSASLALNGPWYGLRLVDLADDVVASIALDAADDPIVSAPALSDSGDVARIQALFGDPGGGSVSLLLAQSGLVEDVPVIEGAVPEVPEGQDPLPVTQAAVVGVHPMQGYRYDLLSTTRTEETTESLTISLGADVLFDVDSAELSDEALAVIEDAAGELQTHEPGAVEVVGHTDDRRDTAYNQDLSEQRAQAVADALAGLIDTHVYPLTVSGKGETEPVASNATAEGRALNRRVELTIHTQQVSQTTDDGAELPAPPDQVATGAEGVVWADEHRSYRITSPGARVVDGNLLVDIAVEATDDAVGSVLQPAIFDAPVPGWIDRMAALRTMCAVAVMDGSTAVFPAWHDLDDSESRWLVLTDLATVSTLDGGDSRTSVIVYPNTVVGDTVTIQLVDVYSPERSWRLTDIPVTAG